MTSVITTPYFNSDPSFTRLAKEDREGKPYLHPAWQTKALELEMTKTGVVAANLAVIPAAAIVGGYVALSGVAGALSMALPVMSANPQVSTNLVPNLVASGYQDFMGISNSTAGATGSGPIRGIKFIISNLSNGDVTITSSADITMDGNAVVTTLFSAEFLIYGVRDSAGALTYHCIKLGGL